MIINLNFVSLIFMTIEEGAILSKKLSISLHQRAHSGSLEAKSGTEMSFVLPVHFCFNLISC